MSIYIYTIYIYLFPFQVKCDHYWPFTEDPVAYGDITVEMLLEEEHTDWVYRNFRISYVSETFCTTAKRVGVILVKPFLYLLSISGIQWKMPERLMALPSLCLSKWLNHKACP